MAIRFDDIGNRLKAFRLGSGLSADEIANRLGISRTALYRFEKGELAKIETLESLAELLAVSVPTLLGVGVEYVPSAVSYFERMRQIEESSEHIIVLVGRLGLPEQIRRERRALARAEAEHFVALMQDEPIGVQIGIVPDTLPHASFQLFRQPDRQVLALSPFRLGEQPNIRVGVAMITSAPEALALHEKMAKDLWQRALKGAAAVQLMRSLIAKV